MPFPGGDGFFVVAHRARENGAPENSLDGIAALPAGVGGVEMDVAFSVDRVPVLMHDATVNRTTSSKGRVDSLNAMTLGTLGVPRLATALKACADFPIALLDMKEALQPWQAHAVFSAIEASAPPGRCIIMVRNSAQAMWWRSLDRELPLGFFGATTINADTLLVDAKRFGACLIAVAPGDANYLANRSVVSKIVAAGFKAAASVVNQPDTMKTAISDGVAVLLTDMASDALGLLRAH